MAEASSAAGPAADEPPEVRRTRLRLQHVEEEAAAVRAEGDAQTALQRAAVHREKMRQLSAELERIPEQAWEHLCTATVPPDILCAWDNCNCHDPVGVMSLHRVM
jgi:hypothetical protein